MPDSPGDAPELDEDARDELLCDIIANHFPEARIDHEAREVALGFGDLTLACKVDSTRHWGAMQSAALFFQLRGGRVGATPVFASASGYGASLKEAIVVGACNWACAFGPVLRAGLAGEELPDVARFELAVHGQRFRAFVDGFDRMFSYDGSDPSARGPAAKLRFAPDLWLTRVILASEHIPMLPADRPSVISVFVSEAAHDRTVEVKLDGCDWPGMAAAFSHVAREAPGVGVMMRELAIAVPIGAAPPLARESLASTLRGLADRAAAAPDHPVNWAGVRHHRHALGEPMPAAALADLQARIGPLPADYRDFLASVAETGAGPGYGLLSPRGDLQTRLARGDFAWDHDAKPRGDPAGVLCLAHAGCGVVWLLVLAGPHRGEVWADAASSDGKARRVAPSFTAWYRDWLAAAVRGHRPWLQWDSLRCAAAGGLSQLIEAVERRGLTGDACRAEVQKQLQPPATLSTMSVGSTYFPHSTPLNPCEGCVDLVARFSPRPDLFQPGREIDVTRSTAAPAKQSWFARLGDKLRRS